MAVPTVVVSAAQRLWRWRGVLHRREDTKKERKSVSRNVKRNEAHTSTWTLFMVHVTQLTGADSREVAHRNFVNSFPAKLVLDVLAWKCNTNSSIICKKGKSRHASARAALDYLSVKYLRRKTTHKFTFSGWNYHCRRRRIRAIKILKER